MAKVLEQVRLLGEAPVVTLLLTFMAAAITVNAWFVLAIVRGKLVPESREEELQDEIKALRAEIAALRTEIKGLQGDIDNIQERELAVARALASQVPPRRRRASAERDSGGMGGTGEVDGR